MRNTQGSTFHQRHSKDCSSPPPVSLDVFGAEKGFVDVAGDVTWMQILRIGVGLCQEGVGFGFHRSYVPSFVYHLFWLVCRAYKEDLVERAKPRALQTLWLRNSLWRDTANRVFEAGSGGGLAFASMALAYVL